MNFSWINIIFRSPRFLTDMAGLTQTFEAVEAGECEKFDCEALTKEKIEEINEKRA